MLLHTCDVEGESRWESRVGPAAAGEVKECETRLQIPVFQVSERGHGDQDTSVVEVTEVEAGYTPDWRLQIRSGHSIYGGRSQGEGATLNSKRCGKL